MRRCTSYDTHAEPCGDTPDMWKLRDLTSSRPEARQWRAPSTKLILSVAERAQGRLCGEIYQK